MKSLSFSKRDGSNLFVLLGKTPILTLNALNDGFFYFDGLDIQQLDVGIRDENLLSYIDTPFRQLPYKLKITSYLRSNFDHDIHNGFHFTILKDKALCNFSKYFSLIKWDKPYTVSAFAEKFIAYIQDQDGFKGGVTFEVNLEGGDCGIIIENIEIEHLENIPIQFALHLEYILQAHIDTFHNVLQKEHLSEFISPSHFEESITFKPQHKLAGVSILSFFAEIVETEFSDQDVKVSIVQGGSKVTLRVEAANGDLLKEVEQTYENYKLAVTGSTPIRDLSNNTQLINQLENRLEMAAMELRLTEKMLNQQSAQYEKRIESLENQVGNLQSMLNENLTQNKTLISTIQELTKANTPTDTLIKAIECITDVLTKPHSDESENQLIESLNAIEKESPNFLMRLVRTAESIPANIASNFASPWVQAIISSLPK